MQCRARDMMRALVKEPLFMAHVLIVAPILTPFP